MKNFIKIIALIFFSQNAVSQNVGIGTTTPHASAKLDVSSTTHGMLVPRMTSAQRNSIATPAAGLLVFDTDSSGFWFYNGSTWSNLSVAGTGWQLTGNTGADTSINFIGNIDNRPLKFKVNNLQAGLIASNGNIFWGPGSGNNSPAVSNNIAIGTNALRKNFREETVAVGAFALANSGNGNHNTAVGAHALENHVTGDLNTAFGNYSLWSQTIGFGNTALGADVLSFHLRGNGNTAAGTNAMFYDTTGVGNTAFGYRSLFNNLNGSGNIGIGRDALLKNATGNNNVAVGYKADALLDNLQNATAIGAHARVDCSNCMVLGSVQSVNGAASNVNVGIGINNPARPLSFPALVGKKISLYPGTSGDVGFGVYGNELRMHSDHSNADITFGYDDYTLGFTERMRIKNTGEFGMELNGRILLKNGSFPINMNATPGIWLNNADNSSLLGFIGTQNNQNIGFYGGPDGWGLTYDAINSRVGIGTSSPGVKLEVNGTIRCISVIQTSDSRLKKDITLLENSLQNITQLNGYNYYWKNENLDNHLQTGVLAQEVKKLFPHLVKEDKAGMLSVNYSGLIPVLIESIKEQQKQIDVLSDQNKTQQMQIDELRKMVEKLLKQ